MFKTLKGKVAIVFAAVMVFALTVVQAAAAEGLKVEAKDFTEPVEAQLSSAIPIVVGFVAVVFAVGFLIRWIMKRARAAT